MTLPNCRIVVSIDDQRMEIMNGSVCNASFEISTAEKGMGFAMGSHRTPTGRFTICEKIGDGMPVGTIFKARSPVGRWQPGDACDDDLVLTRILRLDGIDASNRNTLERFVYIHGTNQEELIGRPAGHGCVRLRNDDMLALFDRVAAGDVVEIVPATRRRGRLAFIAFDSLLVRGDGIASMAALRGAEVFQEVIRLIDEWKSGVTDISEAYSMWMNRIALDDDLIRSATLQCMDNIDPNAAALLALVESSGWLPVTISHTPHDVVLPVAKALGIRHVEAPVADPGTTAGYRYPFVSGLSKADVLRDWMHAMLPEAVIMLGTDHECMGVKPPADLLVSCGVPLPGADIHMSGVHDTSLLIHALESYRA